MTRRRAFTLTSTAAVITSLITACAMRSAPSPRGGYMTEATSTGQPYRKAGPRAEPTTIRGWEARIQSHSAVLRSITAAPPAPPPVSVSPGTAPSRPGTPAGGTGGTGTTQRHSTASKQTLRCQRICKHVKAICYAADRICQIAGRLKDEPSRRACQRNRHRCKSARDVTTRRGCPGCGSVSRRRGAGTRRACLARAPFRR